jgi:hypothetical protein
MGGLLAPHLSIKKQQMKITLGGKVYDVEDSALMADDKLVGEITIDTKDIIRTPEEQTSYEANLKSTHEKAGFEIGIKEFKKHTGVDVTGKSSDAFPAIAKAITDKALAEANLSVDEKVAAKDKDIDTLKQTIGTLEAASLSKDSEIHSIKRNSEVSRTLTGLLPSNLVNSVDDTITLIQKHMSFDLNDNGAVVAKDPTTGEVMKHTSTLDPLPVKDVLDNFFGKNPSYLKPAEGGAGGKDSGGGGGKKTMEKFIEEQKTKGNDPMSPIFREELNAEVKNGTIESE